MAGVSRQKQKLLLMEQLFRAKTDENHAITGNELIKTLVDMGLKAERKTIYDDIATLCDAGLNIETTKIGHSNAYYMGERLFDMEELGILCDAVAASRFLTIKRSGEIIKKLQTLTSEHKAPALRRSVHIENRTKSSGDNTYKIVDTCEEAIYSDKKVAVSVGEQGGDKKRRSENSVISPYQIVWENDHYYVICKPEGGGVVRLRADRIGDAALLDEKRESPTEDEELTIRKLKAPLDTQGAVEELRIMFSGDFADDVLDRFGDKTVIHRDGSSFYVDVSTQLSPAFWGWLFQFGDKAQIVTPAYVRELAAQRLEKISKVYEKTE